VAALREKLEEKSPGLSERLARGASPFYFAKRCVECNIPKADRAAETAGVSGVGNDKIVQGRAAVEGWMNALTKRTFSDFRNGSRTRGGSQHHRMECRLYTGLLTRGKVNWVLLCDIKGVFDGAFPMKAL